MSSDSGSILWHEPGIQHESIATTSESFQELALPNDVATMQVEWAQACKEEQYLRAHQCGFKTSPRYSAGVPDTEPVHHAGPSWPHPAQGMSTALEMDHTGYAYATAASALLSPVSDLDATMTLSDGSDLEASSPASNETMCASGSSRSASSRVLGKRKAWQTEDSSLDLSLPPCKRRGFHHDDDDDDDDIKEGKFGAYRLANASAVVMTMPIHDLKPVDICNCRTHDANGNLLKTRRFGAIELDDSYPKRRVTVGKGLPTGMTCVQACNWGHQPCGLFIEINKVHVMQHLFFLAWHQTQRKDTLQIRELPKASKDDEFGPSYRESPLHYSPQMRLLRQAEIKDRFFGMASEVMQSLPC
ncbi:hypothetical protein EDD22DRAFT_955728 [Suillus occidentalis]|nr:hypothetical protein EDD22DRAFT_955728 [Suillus occidentalis]